MSYLLGCRMRLCGPGRAGLLAHVLDAVRERIVPGAPVWSLLRPAALTADVWHYCFVRVGSLA